MANEQQRNPNAFNPHSLKAAQDVLSSLKSQAAEAEKRGDAFTFGLMNQLVKVVSPIVTRAHARLIREEKAEMNRKHEALKKQTRGNAPFKRDDNKD